MERALRLHVPDQHQHGLGDGVSNPANFQPGTEADGGIVLYGAGTGSGSKQYVWISSKYQATLSGMYTLPLDFNLATSLFVRDGYPVPYYRRVNNSGNMFSWYGAYSYYQLGNADDERLNTVVEWDLGLSKVIRVGGLGITVMADVFNVLNRNTVLQRSLRVYSPAGATTNTDTRDNNIYEQQAPRIWRFGARLSF